MDGSEEQSLPLGKRKWTIDRGLFGKTEELVLTFSSCNKSEFTCSDGSCTAMSSRCDFLIDCTDGNDEEQCDVIKLPEQYNNKIPPRMNDSHDIKMEVIILSLDIETSSMELSLDLDLKLIWTDERLEFHNLKPEDVFNALDLNEMRSIWYPEISFRNAMGNINTQVDSQTKAFIHRNGSFTSGISKLSREGT